MTLHAIKTSAKFFFAFSFAFCISFAAARASAAPLAPVGCNPAILTAMNAKAEAQVAYDVAVTRELITQPVSVLEITCFNGPPTSYASPGSTGSVASISAKKGGAIFSGDFTNDLNNIMTVTGGVYFCKGLDDMWLNILNAGISNKVPYATFDDLMKTTAPPGAGLEYKAGWAAANSAAAVPPNGVWTNFKNAYNAIPAPAPLPPLGGTTSSCDVLLAAGIYAGPCPPP